MNSQATPTWLLSCLEEPLLSLCVGDGDVMVAAAAAAAAARFVVWSLPLWEQQRDRQRNERTVSLTFEGHREDETE